MHAQHTPTWRKSSYSNAKDDCHSACLTCYFA
jgi:hypothetical protein